jgi:hypothetical protein
MKMYDGCVCGLRLIADDSTFVFDETWQTYKPRGEWQTQDLNDDEQILGLAANKDEDDTTLKIAWILGSAFEQSKTESAAYDTNGSWRPKILKPISFGETTSLCDERTLKSEK